MRIPAEEVSSRVEKALGGRWLLVFNRRAMLLAPADAIREAIESMPAVRSVRVERRLPGTITVHIDERIASVQWESAGESYEVDLEGKVIRPLAAASGAAPGPSLPRIVGDTDATTTVTVGEVVALPELIQLAIDAAPGPQGRGSDYATPGASHTELNVHVGGMEVLLTTNETLDEQYRSARSVMASLPREDVGRIQTIDVRLPELATYRLR